ncbi:putative bifunctional diguanylate cyclase/phosphodiesterase [Leptothrix sp. BB-3]
MTPTSRTAYRLWQRWMGASPAPARPDFERTLPMPLPMRVARRGGDEIVTVIEPLHGTLSLAAAANGDTLQMSDWEDSDVIDPDVADEGRPLLRALARGQFELHYQAQFDCVNRQLIGVEALLRWLDPTHGLRMPGEFIGAAERSGAIRHLDAWALRTACQQMRHWQDMGIAPPLMAVNVSAPLFARDDLVDLVAEVLRETGLDADCLELEIVERALLDPVHAAPTMRRLRAMGVRLAIDDFGTGYSSLGYLSRYPVNRLKIDRCFVAAMGRDRTSVAITDAVVALGLSLGLDVVAEGVETEDQLEHLRLHLCPAAQGWLFGHPQPAGTFAHLLRRENQRR